MLEILLLTIAQMLFGFVAVASLSLVVIAMFSLVADLRQQRKYAKQREIDSFISVMRKVRS